MPTKWLAMRPISAMMTRRCLAFSGNSSFSSFSTVSAQPRFMFIPAR